MDKYGKRLLKLADFLDKLPPKRFNYCKWVGDDWRGAKDLSCGTTACALGWATTIPQFRKLGLFLRPEDACISSVYKRFEVACQQGGAILESKEADMKGGYSHPAAAAKEVFGLSYDEYTFVFVPAESLEGFEEESPADSASAKEVATHIRKFVAHKYGKATK